MDTTEIYAFVVQDEVHGFHWNNNQATLHPFITYFKNNRSIASLSFVIISDCLKHDTVAVHLFQKYLIQFLNQKFSHMNKIYYFSDGAASQYKNRKKFINICHHRKDFNLHAEWHFFATSNGKGPCDGIGGTVKRLAARSSLQHPTRQHVTTPIELYQWANENIKGINFQYVAAEEYANELKALECRFGRSRTVPGTQGLHAVMPIFQHKLQVKTYSSALESAEVTISKD